MSVWNNFETVNDKKTRCDVANCNKLATYKNKLGVANFCTNHMKRWEEKLRTNEIKNMKSIASHNFHRNKPIGEK